MSGRIPIPGSGRPQPGRLVLAAGILAALLAACTDADRRYPVTADNGFRPVEVVVENEGTAELRCTLVLAHFITQDLGVIAPGEGKVVMLERRSEDGLLAAGRHKGEPMLVENLLCGADGDWQGTAGDLPLLDIRGDNRPRYLLGCRAGDRLACEVR